MFTAVPEHDLRLTVELDGQRAYITADGNLDDFTAGLLRDRLKACVAEGARSFTVYLRHIGLIDSSGLSALVFGYKLAHQGSGDFRLCGDEEVVARLLHRTALDRLIPLRPPVEELPSELRRATGTGGPPLGA
jgi:anti-sigma B factor antagonist